MQYITTSKEETMNLGKDLAAKLRGSGGVVALVGNLGAGKTTFVQGFAQGLEIKDKILSPTYVLIRQHKIPETPATLYHVDLYRLENEKDLTALGLDEFWGKIGNIVIIEWAEKIKIFLPNKTKWINFKILEKNRRGITITNLF